MSMKRGDIWKHITEGFNVSIVEADPQMVSFNRMREDKPRHSIYYKKRHARTPNFLKNYSPA